MSVEVAKYCSLANDGLNYVTSQTVSGQWRNFSHVD